MDSETTEEVRDDKIFKTLELILKRLDGYDTQFEAIRQGIVDNSVRFDRLDAQMFSMRSDIANLKADVKGLTEEVRHNRTVLV